MKSLDYVFEKIKRQDFATPEIIDSIDIDIALPIGFGQTISQPSTVFNMMSWLEALPDDKILDIGSGSGWTTALLSEIVGEKGRVFSVEIIPELLEFGKANCRKIGVKNAEFHIAGETLGLPKYAPYDRILVSAAAREFPKELPKQLKIGGKLVIPVNNDILEITKINNHKIETITHPGFIFVPLVTKRS
jgi:protein-L-isoaspartate(D-aspartate) O-methyltransferase